MNKEEYLLKLNELRKKHEVEICNLKKEYVFINNKIKIGDIIEDHIGKIKVEKFMVTSKFLSEIPEMCFEGRVLKKDGTPTKKEEYRFVYSSNLLDISLRGDS